LTHTHFFAIIATMAKDLGEAGTDLQQICHLTEDFTDKHIFDILIWDAKADYAFLTSAALTLAPASVYICMLGQKSNHQLRKVRWLDWLTECKS
jgi:hypothetical protein